MIRAMKIRVYMRARDVRAPAQVLQHLAPSSEWMLSVIALFISVAVLFIMHQSLHSLTVYSNLTGNTKQLVLTNKHFSIVYLASSQFSDSFSLSASNVTKYNEI